MSKKEILVSVSSRSYILSYFNIHTVYKKMIAYKFPSPLGVIFSLIENKAKWYAAGKMVSVSSRSYILSYTSYSYY